MPRTNLPPSYRFHKARNCAVVTIDGRNHYLGPFGSPESREKYARLIVESQVDRRQDLSSSGLSGQRVLTVNEVILTYWQFAQTYYVKHGQPTDEQAGIRSALRFLGRLYGFTPARDFSPLGLKAVRDTMIESGLSRGVVNKYVQRIRRMFRWGVENELVTVDVYMKKSIAILAAILLVSANFSMGQSTRKTLEADIVIYGGTSAAVIAAVQVKKLEKSVIIISPDKHLGGLSSGGLGWTDTGNKSVIGGISREFYQRIFGYYDKPETWKWQDRSDYSFRGRVMPPSDSKERSMWIFEPRIAEQVFEDLVAEYKIPVYRDEWLNRKNGVKKEDGRISSITTLSDMSINGKVFIDATYEGDLMAAAGVNYHVGREANSVYDESWNGIQVGILHHDHHFGELQVSPYNNPGDPNSGVIPKVSAADPGKKGDGDKRVQAYCFRMCLTDHPENRVPFPKPEGYDPAQYELLLRIFEAGLDPMYVFAKFDLIPNRKTDTNNHGPFSFDNIGMNWDYPEASYERRREIIKEHETYQKGLLYFICTDPRVPNELQQRMNTWGLAKDEFADNGNWPHQLYVREARRMIGEYVTTENDVLGKRQPPRPIGMGSYTMDSHNVQRYIQPNGFIQNEGDIGVPPKTPYQIAYGSLVPKKEECNNLVVPVCVSSSHIAFGSIRMEPVFMVLGQSAATAASLAIDHKVTIQDVPYSKLRRQLLADGQVLERPAKPKAPASAQIQGQRPVEQLEMSKPKIVCFGDSFTKRGYPDELATLLGVEVLNSGIAGNTTRHGLRRLKKDLLDHKPEIAVILFGTNDSRLAEEHVHVPLDQYSTNLSEINELIAQLVASQVEGLIKSQK